MTFCPNLISATCATFSASKKTQVAGLDFHQPAEVTWSLILTDHGSDPLRLGLLLHNLLRLLWD